MTCNECFHAKPQVSAVFLTQCERESAFGDDATRRAQARTTRRRVACRATLRAQEMLDLRG
jgi:hypothetical protein